MNSVCPICALRQSKIPKFSREACPQTSLVGCHKHLTPPPSTHTHTSLLSVFCRCYGILGHCLDGLDSFNCRCDPGFTGEQCQTNIDDCVGVRCSGNGECLDGVNSFTCECSPGYTGPHCDIQGLLLL